MATVSVVLRTNVLLVFIFVCLQFCAARLTPPAVNSFTVTNENIFRSGQNGGSVVGTYAVQLRGFGFFANMQWKLTPKSDVFGALCDGEVDGSFVREIEASFNKYVAEVVAPVANENVYFCLLFGDKWIHQGYELTFVPSVIDDNQFSQQNAAPDSNYPDAGQLPLAAGTEVDRDEGDSQIPQRASDRDLEGQVQIDRQAYGLRDPKERVYNEDVEDVSFGGENSSLDSDINSVLNTDEMVASRLFISDKKDSIEGNMLSPVHVSSDKVLNEISEPTLGVLIDSPNDGTFVPGYRSNSSSASDGSNNNETDVLNLLGDAQNLRREPVVIDISNDLSDKMYKEEKDREYLSNEADFFGNLDEIDTTVEEPAVHKKVMIDLSHDIDVNYDENGLFIQQTEAQPVPNDKLKYLTNKHSHGPNDIEIISIIDKRDKKDDPQVQRAEVNTWKHFKDTSSEKIPSHWIDLSHDIDVNYPKPGSGIVLDVEGDDVEKNIYDDKSGRDVEDIEMQTTGEIAGEFDDYAKMHDSIIKSVQSGDVLTPKDDTPKMKENDSEIESKREELIHDVEEYNLAQVNDEFEALSDDHIKQVTTSNAPEKSDEKTDSTNDRKNAEKFNELEYKLSMESSTVPRRKRQAVTETLPYDYETTVAEHMTAKMTVPSSSLNFNPRNVPLKIDGLRVEGTDRPYETTEGGIPELLAYTEATVRIFGIGITEDTLITFTHQPNKYGGACQFPATDMFKLEKEGVTDRTARVRFRLPIGQSDSPTFYICAKRPESSYAENPTDQPFVHQGSEPWLCLKTYAKLLPLWASLMIIATCLLFSALFSGLNLGLMSLDRTELKILCNTGTEKEKEYARVIQPVRDHGNYLLCSILLGNVAVNSTFTILLDDLTSGVFAVIFSTITIVLLGEITPQAICSRYGLAVGAKTIHVTKAVMIVTFPLSYPVSKILDCILGEEIGNVYNRERLKELVRVTNDINDLDKDEVNIISGALELRKKTVLEIMTKIEDVFMLDYEAVLDFETVSEIMKSGFSRIPVFEGKRGTIVAMLYVKDLAFVDPDDNTPLKTLCQFYQNPCNFVFEDVTLDVIFKQFKEGHKGHLAFVQRVNSEGEGDPFYETIGLVTLEDVIEEIIQAEIMDETDVFTDNKSKRRRNRPLTKLKDFGVFAERRENQRIRISPQLTLATFQYLSTAVDAFKPDVVSETILRRMLKQDVIHHIKFRNKERQKTDPSTLIYEQGKPVDYFVLILEGRVEVTVGKESLVFESGPFTYFGSQALMQNVGIAESPVVPPSALGSLQSINMDSMLRYTFVPDYSVRAVTEVFYVNIKRQLYLAAKRATLMERCSGSRHKGSEDAGEQFDDEVEKLLHSLEEEGSPVNTARSPSHHLNSRHTSPLGPNGSLKTSRQSSPAKHAPVAQQEPEFMDATPPQPQETSTLLPHS